MTVSPVCTGLRQVSMFGVTKPAASQDVAVCRSHMQLARRDVHARHLGAKSSLGSCRGLVNKHHQLRPVLPRQGRLHCQAAKQSEVT